MKFSHHLRLWLALATGMPLLSPAADAVKTWTGSANNALNNVSNWDNGTRPTFGAAANTDALLFTGRGTGIINVNVDATSKSISVSGELGYTFQGASPLRLGDTTTVSVQPNSGLFINNSTAPLALTTTGGIFFTAGRLEAATGPISVGNGSFLDIGNGSAIAGHNLTIAGPLDVTVNGLLAGLGTQTSPGGHLIKDGAGTLALNGSSATWNGRVLINQGKVKINRATSLGSAVGDTTLGGGASTGHLELSGGIALEETLVVAGRDSAAAPLLVNASGDNILVSPLLLNAGGTEYAIVSQAGTLTLQGAVDYGTSTGATTLHLTGDGGGIVSSIIGAGGDALGISKAGAGTWSLTGANAFTGPVNILAGRVNLTTSHAAQNVITVADGASLGIAVTTPGQSVNATSLSLAGSTGTALAYDLGSQGNPSVPLLKTSSLTVTGVVGVALKGGGLSIGQIPLIDYDGSIGGAGFGGFILTELPARVTAALVDDVANGQVLLNVSGFDLPRWTGEVDATWDINDGTGIGTTNWRERNSGILTRYLQSSASTDAVLFDDTATGSTDVVLTTSLSPASVTVDNAAKLYTFRGPGSLNGAGTLVKKGSGELLLINSGASTFTGGVTLEAGVVHVGDGITSGAGSLGNGPVANAGQLIFDRPDAYTFAGAISGAGSLIKKGAGITTLSGNSSFTSETQVQAGTLRLGNANALGDTAAGTVVSAGASLDVNGQLLPAGEIVTIIGAGAGEAGALVNTGAGGAGVGLKNLVLSGPASFGGSARWDVRDSPGGVNANGHDLTKTGSNVVQLADVGETHLGNIFINGPGSRLTLAGNTTQGDRTGVIRIESGAQLGLEESTVAVTKPIFTELGTINATGGTTNVITSTINITTGLTVNSTAASEIVLAGKITGNGDLSKTTGGIVKITNDNNDYTGTTTIGTGPFWIGNDGPTGRLPAGEIINNGNLIFRRTGDPLVVTQTISGSGQLTFPAGTAGDDYVVTLAGDNSFNGNVTINRAFVKAVHNTSLGVTLPPAGEGLPAPTKLITIGNARRPSLLLDGSSGNITLPPTLLFLTSSDGPQGAIVNVAGDNIIQGAIDLNNGGGGNTRIRVSGGSLTLAGPVRSASTSTSARVLFLDGDVEGATGTVDGVLSTGGPFALSVTKAGTGTWLLNAVNTYTGNTAVTVGTLKLGPAASISTSPAIDLTAGATLDVTAFTAGYSLGATQQVRGSGRIAGSVALPTGSTLNPGTTAIAGSLEVTQDVTLNGGRYLINLDSQNTQGAGVNDLLTIGRDLILAAPSTLEIAATGTRPQGSYRIANYGGTLTGDTATISIINPTRYSAALDSSTPGQLNLLVGGSNASLVWSGNGSTNVWNRTATDAWNAGTDIFYQSDAVLFDDTAAGINTTITLGEALVPTSVTVSASQNYTFSGTGSIGGTTGLTKSGTGSLTINTVNGFTGKVKISGGSIILGATGRLNGTPWIEVDQGTLLDAHAIVAGFTLGGTDPRVISGRGTLIGNYIINVAGSIKPGDSSAPNDLLTAGDGIGSLTFNGNLTLGGAATAGSPRATLRLAGATGTVADPLNSASVAALGLTVPTLHDHLQVTGTFALDAGSTIRIELAESYTPALGDVFNLADWGSLNLNADAAGEGFNVALATDLELPVLPTGLYWNRSLFATDGLLFISPEPPVLGAVQISPSNTVNPGTQVTLSLDVTGLQPYTYQWKRNGQDIALATSATYAFAATEADQASYSVTVTNPAGATTSTAVSLTVNDPVVISTPPQGQTFNPGADVTFSVGVSGTAPFTYQWRKNGAPLDEETSDTLQLSSVTEADQATYDVIVSNVTGSVTSAPANLVINDLVVITRQPTPQGALENGSVTFSVEFTGTGPFAYRWSKNGVELEGSSAAEASLTLNGLTDSDAGDYSVRITGIAGSALSDPASLVIVGNIPKIISISSHRLNAVGTAVTLSVQAVGRSPVSYQWYKGAAKVTGGTGAQLQINNAQLKDAGAYRVDVVAAGSAPVASTTVEVGLVDAAARTITLPSGGATKLDVKTAGNSLTYVWQKDGAPLTADTRITGTTTAVLSLGKPIDDPDSGLYTLVVSGPGGTLTTAGHQLSIFAEAPVITENPPVFPAAIVGGDFTPYSIKVDSSTRKAPTAYAAAGLPPGLKVDVKTGRITGKPTAVSKDPLGYLVKLTASNSKGKSTAEGRLIVQALPENAIGTFTGSIGRHAINQNLGGKLELVIAKTGAYTGKLYLGTATLALKGALLVTPAIGDAPSTQSGNLTLLRKGLSSLGFTFTLDAPNNRIATATVTDGDNEIAFIGWRNKWSKTLPATTEFGTYHTFALGIPTAFIDDVRVPQGDGYGSFTIAADGKLSVTGKLADGEVLTHAGFVGPEGEITIFKTLYKTVEKGSVAGALDINAPNLTGSPTWSRPATPSDKHRLYKAGFPEVLTLTAFGGQYTPPVAPEVFLGLPVNSNATLGFSAGGSESFVTLLTDLDLTAPIGLKSKVVLPANATQNPRKPTLVLTEKTGLFKGGFNLENANPLPAGKPVLLKQAVKYEGIAVRQNGVLRGAGFFLLNQLPTEATPVTTPTLSGHVNLAPPQP